MRINIPPVTRVLLLLTAFFSFLYIIAIFSATHPPADGAQPAPAPFLSYLALIPSTALFHPWTIVTSFFVEQNIVTLLVNGAAIYFSGKYLERAWGSREFALVVAIAAIIPNLLVIPTYVIWGFVMGNSTRADTPITGAITMQAAFLVAFKQLVPEHTVSLYKGLVKVRVKHFPAIFLLVNALSGVIFGTDTALLLGWYGLVTTWIYLRFFKRQPDISGTGTTGGPKGDASETFAFATFFPNIIQPPIAAVCDRIYLACCNLNIIQPFSDEAIASGNEQAAARGEGGLPTVMGQARGARPMTKREEAERRRQLALQALDQRLNAASTRAPLASSNGNPAEEVESAQATNKSSSS